MFAPTVEEHFKGAPDTFISDLPINILRNHGAHRVPWMAGVNSEEGLLYSGRIMQDPNLIREFESNTDTVFPQLLAYNNERTDVTDKILKFYFGADANQLNFMEKISNYTNLFSDAFYSYGTKEAALIHAHENPTYLYYNNYQAQFSLMNYFSIRPGSLPMIIAQVLYKRAKEWFLKTAFGIPPHRYPGKKTNISTK
jgi:carboxylesterase type B